MLPEAGIMSPMGARLNCSISPACSCTGISGTAAGLLLVTGTGAGGCYCSHSAAEGAVAAGGGDQSAALAGAAGLLPNIARGQARDGGE